MTRACSFLLLVDVYLLAEGSVFLGGFSSNLARLAFSLSSSGTNGCLKPYESSDINWCFAERGGNDMIRRVKSDTFREEYGEILRMLKEARPGMACLVMSPLDHGTRVGQRIESLPVVERLVTAQRDAAQAEGCAFFDTHAAMGGKGSAGRWFKRSPRLIAGDLSHVTRKGQVVIGEMLYRALVQAYARYRQGLPLTDDAAKTPPAVPNSEP